ncbi:MAG: branched-chain amino acid ABC transporter permease [Actinomycetota bacterium]|nr:branched-chain amino acid ABC transporter permease [Actinomycetota bacterium]
MARAKRGHAGGDHAEISLKDFRPAGSGLAFRIVAAIALATGIFLIPVTLQPTQDLWLGLGAIYAIIALSVNVITGHAGQISLGHQAFVGIGAFMSAYAVKGLGNFPTVGGVVLAPATIPTSDFWIAIILAGFTGTALALLLGLVALRIRGLYLALITLAFGLMAENTIFNWGPFTGGGAGAVAPRPAAFESNQAFAYACLLVLGLFLFVDWRLERSRAGRAIVAIRNEERVAMTLGVNVTRYKLLAFAVAGFIAGVAGGLFGHWNQAVQALDFDLRIALVWVLMTVVGGFGSRAGVVAGGAFFAVFPLYLSAAAGGSTLDIPFVGEILIQTLSPFFGALLLLLTITLYPGGIAQQLLPFRRWLSGGPFVESRHEAFQLAGFPFLLGLLVTLAVMGGDILLRLAVGAVIGLVAAAIVTVLLLMYVRALIRSVAARRPEAADEELATAPGAAELVHADEEATEDGSALVEATPAAPAASTTSTTPRRKASTRSRPTRRKAK